MAETEAADSQPEVPASDATVEVQEAELPEVPDVKSARAGGQIDVLLDSTLPVEAHLGQHAGDEKFSALALEGVGVGNKRGQPR